MTPESKNKALHEAIERDDPEAVRSLLKDGADPNAAGVCDRLPLGSTADKEIVALLLAYGADPNLPEQSGLTPLDVAVNSVTPLEVIEMLMKAGANPHRITPTGFSTFTYACKNARIERVKVLIQCGADVNRPDSKGLTPLLAAKRRPDVQALLHAAGAKPSDAI